LIRRNKNRTTTESIASTQLKVLGYLIAFLTAIIILVTIFLGIFPTNRIDKLEADVEIKLQKQDDRISDAMRTMEERYNKIYDQIESKLNNYESKTESKINRFEDKSDYKFDKAIDDLNSDFEKLAGESAAKPKIEILYDGEPLNGRTINIKILGQRHFYLHNISLKNSGSRIAVKMILRLSFTHSIINSDWARYNIPDDGYVKSMYWRAYDSDSEYITPGDSWNKPFKGDYFQFYNADIKPEDTPYEVKCKLDVLYESPIQATAEFSILFSYE